ncbi:hypothetical protein FSP39_020188 [Pinctada imbricata]|uniref:Spermatogenesis-associated protein 20-like TRX domain-containing protein n=1 Tax=Pinctada imbricata TaxID=66713 RepID=A0AA89BMQ8_PINIB|nr:hypothetical protein FSP39_020188 [Pinctada imbricata]
MATKAEGGRNRLANEKSPYLLQHASNPVDWYPWGQEAFDKAKSEGKLIFLSVGYSTCHWCHVMERESFENEEIGKIMNEHYVSVKVDREERPDVDRVYMTFVQATSGGGGWPMSVWLTPDLKPLYGGTYFPPDDRYFGRPGFKTVLRNLAQQWIKKKDMIEQQTDIILQTLQEGTKVAEAPGESLPDKSALLTLFNMLLKSYDSEYGGFSKEPKFPQPVNFNFLFAMYAESPEDDESKSALSMCVHTLKMMAKGGICDHISKGFHRYSTDQQWHVPHFEKMLYDQGQLLVSYANAFQITGDPEFRRVASDIAEYVSRDLSHKDGGFYSAEDADSFPTPGAKEKKEGAFCVWTHSDLHKLLGQKVKDNHTEADVFCHHFDVKENGNVDPYKDPHDELKGQNVLIMRGSVPDTAKHFGLTEEEVTDIIDRCKSVLHDERQKRPKPHLDNKMIASWNGLMISGYARAGSVLKDTAMLQRAKKAADFLRQTMFDESRGILYRTSYVDMDGNTTKGDCPVEGFVDDYSDLIQGLVDLYEATFSPEYLLWAEKLQEKQNELFWDKTDGGYYSNTGKDPSIVLKLKDDQDGAEPCPNSVSANNLLRLSNLLQRPEWQEMAADILKLFYERVTKIPIAVPEMLCALIKINKPPKQVVLVGDNGSEDLQSMIDCVASRYIPNKVLIVLDGTSSELQDRVPFLQTLSKVDGKATAYVCENYACSLPVNTVDALQKLLQHPGSKPS